MVETLAKRIKDILGDYENHNTLSYLHALEKALLKLETITVAYQRDLFPISRERARTQITEQVNIISSLFKTLGNLNYYPALVDMAIKEVLHAYRATIDEGREKAWLEYSLDMRTWDECIATILRLNKVENRIGPFVTGLISPHESEAYILPPVPPAKWKTFVSALKQEVKSIKEDMILLGGWAVTGIATIVVQAMVFGSWALAQFVNAAKSAQSFLKEAHDHYKEWSKEPEEPKFPDGYYNAPPISDQQLNAASRLSLWRAQTERNAIKGAKHAVENAKEGVEKMMNRGDNDDVTDGEPGTITYPPEKPDNGHEDHETYLSEYGTPYPRVKNRAQ